MEEDQELNDSKSINSAIRSAKKAHRPVKIGMPEPKNTKKSKKTRSSLSKKGKSAFDSDLGSKRKVIEGVRSKKDDAIRSSTKKGGKRVIKGRKGGAR